VQRLFYPEAKGKAHCYLLHPPGGVVLGDHLTIGTVLHSGAVLVTTPSASRFYTVADFREEQSQELRLRADAGCLEWLPQETILFSGARARLRTRIDLGEEAELAYWDILVLGRPACGESFSRGRVLQSLSCYRAGRLLFSDRLEFEAGDRLTRSRMGLASSHTLGIMVLSRIPARALLDRWLEAVNPELNEGPFSVTIRQGLLVARYLGDSATACRLGFTELWSRASAAVHGKPPVQPRIWHT
jgi:urease accessory protein